ncbi:TetR/AcrR family transcriptional regulator [Actinopolymorpha pittospori]
MTATRTFRERARAEFTQEIKDIARRQLAETGVAALSLRAVARELGVASSALYRYFPSRDALLTALIVDAFTALGDRAESAVAKEAPDDFLRRWRAACRAVRAWARESPHEYALVYGSPVPGYAAPEETIAAALRVPYLLLGLARDAWNAGRLVEPTGVPELSGDLAEQASRLAALTGFDGLPDTVLVRTVTAWTQVFGATSLELFGHLKGAFTDDTAFFTASVDLMASMVGFRDPS